MIKLAHISDLHIRNYQRHWEYKLYFNTLYESLRKNKPDYIVFTGDLGHTKTNISPEFFKISSELFKNLSNIATLIVIPGNHDGSINNLSRLDVISPIVEALDNRNIFYFKKSGVNLLGNGIRFIHFSCYDNDWVKESDKTDEIVIGLYHGLINGARLQNNLIVDKSHNLDYFMDKVDYLFCGDLHEQQFLNKEKTAAYAGSAIQQNYGESRTKGYLLWEIEEKNKHTVSFVDLTSICPFYTLKLKEDLKVSNNYKIQKNSRIRVLSKQLLPSQQKDIKDALDIYYEPYEIKFVDDCNPYVQDIKINGSYKTKIENLSELKVQEKLIKQFLNNHKLDSSQFDRIFSLNKKYHNLIVSDNSLRNVNYNIKKIKFSNICSFAENNEIDFEKYNGILGIFGKNGTGKSTAAIDALSYTIFNKISKKGVVKNDILINDRKDSCCGTVEVEVEDDIYEIERDTSTYLKAGKRAGNPIFQGKTNVNFTINGISENGDSTPDTNKKIRQFFGNYDDFICTTVAPQWQLLNFIDAGSTEREKIIARYFDIGIFEDKYKIANEDKRELREKIKLFENRNFDENILNCKNKYNEINLALEKEKNNQLTKELEKKNIEKDISELKSFIIKIDEIGDYDLLSIDKIIDKLHKDLTSKKHKQSDFRKDKDKIKKKNDLFSKKLSEIDIEKLKEDNNKYKELSISLSGFIVPLNRILEDLEAKEKKIEQLKLYGCISNSNCCMLKELNLQIEKKKELETQKEKINKSLNECEEKISKYDINTIRKKIKEHEDLSKKIETEQWSLKLIEKDIEVIDRDIELLENNIKTKNDIRDKIENNKELVVKNNETNDKIVSMEVALSDTEKTLKDYYEIIFDLNRKLGNCSTLLEQEIKEKEKYEDLLKEWDAYDYFLRCMSKDGISKIIIFNNLNIINSEIKRILNNMVPFTITLEANENRDIEIYFNYEKGEKRIIELCSGMEKVFSSVVIRVALIGITTLPKSNLFILDEVAYLDGEYLDIFVELLNKIKDKFHCVVLISHNELLKDNVDFCIEVDRDEGGFSRLN